jgi:proline iminopeptidase
MFFDVDGSTLVADGSQLRRRPTLLLVHGAEVDHAFFKPWVEPLSDVAQLVYVDLLGHGRIDVGERSDWTIDAWAASIDDFCSQIELELPVVLGSSIGGKIALALALRNPRRPRAVVVVNAVLQGRPERRIEIFRRLGGDAAATAAQADMELRSDATKDEYLRVCMPLTVQRPYSADELARLRPVTAPVMDALIAAGSGPDGLLDRVASITCPVLVMTGELDPAAPPDDAADLVRAIGSNATLAVIDGAGHGVYRDRPDEFVTVVTGFLAGLEL